MKKILFVTSNLGIGGAQQHLILYANHLHEAGYEVLIINTDNNNDFIYRLNSDIELINIPRKYNFDLSPSKGIYDITIQRGHDTVFCDSLFAYLFVRKLLNMPLINISVIFHTTNYVDTYNYLKDLGVRLILSRKVKLIAVAQNQIDRLSKTLCIKKSRFKLIYNGINSLNFSLKKRQELRELGLRKELGIPNNAFVVIKTARFAPEKNHELAIQILDLLIRTYNIQCYFIFVGNTNRSRMDKIQELANQKGLTEYVKIVGNQKDVRPYLAISDLFILTSKSVETFSIAALEAMGMGLPCVLSDVGGANEMVFNGKNGFVVPFTNPPLFAQRIQSVFLKELELGNKEISDFILEKFNINDTNSQLEEFSFKHL